MKRHGLTRDIVQTARRIVTGRNYRGRCEGQGRVVTMDPEPEKGFYLSLRHFEFARKESLAF